MSNPLESWTEEQRSAYLYRACAEAEAGTSRADLFRRLAGEAEAQAAIWRAVLAAMKVRGMAIYTRREPGGHSAPVAGGIEHRHRGLGGGGNLRAAVFGVNDGLVSNASLIFGVAGATANATSPVAGESTVVI